MGDVAQILKGPSSRARPGMVPSKAMKLSGVSKEVMELLGGKHQDPISAALPPIVPTFLKRKADHQSQSQSHQTETTNTNTNNSTNGGKEIKVKVGSKWISSSTPARPWTWAPFASSSRTDGAMFRHWVRANVEYTDYPYAKFDIHLDAVAYTNDEYTTYCQSESWTKSETDQLMELVRRYELRWPVIHDRWLDHYHAVEDGGNLTLRKVEDLQERYYSVAAILAQIRIRQEAASEVQALIASANPDSQSTEAKEKAEQILLETAAARALATAAPKTQPLVRNLGTGSTNKVLDAKHERERRAHLDRLWRRSKEEENEELELRKQLKLIEAQLRKLKKSGGHILTAPGGAARGQLSSAASSRNPSRAVSPVPSAAMVDNPEMLHQSFSSTAPVPMPQNPYLQSGRLTPPATGGSVGLNKTMLARMHQVLAELKVPSRPLPTKAVCDLYDTVRKDILTLVTLQKMVLQKEGTLQAKRVKLSKLGGGEVRVLDEESLLGIAPPPAPPPPIPTPAKKTTKSSKSKASASKAKASSKKEDATTTTTATATTTTSTTKVDGKDGVAKRPKSGTKRKRKPDTDTKDGKDIGKKTPVSGASTSTKTAATTIKTPGKAVPKTSAKTPGKTAVKTPATTKAQTTATKTASITKPAAASTTAPTATAAATTNTPAKTAVTKAPATKPPAVKTPAKTPATTGGGETSSTASGAKKRARKS